MSSHFSCNQFESAFVPQRLQNYEVPRQHKEHPARRNGTTEIIVNDRGHLNKCQKRSLRSPWSDYLGTWQRPQREIQLKIRTKYMSKRSSSLAQKPAPGDSLEIEGNKMQSQTVSEKLAASPTNELRNSTPASHHSSRQGTPSQASRPGSKETQTASTRGDSKSQGGTPSGSRIQSAHSQLGSSQSASAGDQIQSSGGDAARSQRGSSTGYGSRVQSAQSHCESSQSASRRTSSATSNRSAVSPMQSSRAKSASSVRQSRPHSRMCDDGEASGIESGSRVYTPPTSASTRPSSHSQHLESSFTTRGQLQNAAVQCPTPST